ncbi:PhzF family phenazine biosynthesis protein [Xylogone sp. PMI_703]|nr:PhzF family phenazine biosynthesis protein [Xylogone sp. PMI_703]
MSLNVHLLKVFAATEHGGNPLPVVIDASDLSRRQMQNIAKYYGHESGFIIPAAPGCEYDYTFKFWVPGHEMEMCGHATIGGVYLLHKLGILQKKHLKISTLSGIVEVNVTMQEDIWVEISQPCGIVNKLSEDKHEEILSVLGILQEDLAEFPLQNSMTSRVKTLIPLSSVATLDKLEPDFSRMQQVCGNIGSTGLYPYAIQDLHQGIFSARQFPKSSGYPEDAATGIAGAALAFGLLENRLVRADSSVKINQGVAMGHPSQIAVRFRVQDGKVLGCWLGGNADYERVEEIAF